MVYSVLIVTVVLTATAMALWFERKFAARLQTRLGPTMVGPSGPLQPVADLLKLLQKEDIVPDNADAVISSTSCRRFAALTALGAAAVVPFSPTVVASDLDVGVLYVLAIGAVTVLPIFGQGGQATTSWPSSAGCARVAQSISYEVPLLLSAMVPIILSGSMRFGAIVQAQADHHWFVVWPFFIGIPAFGIFLLAMLAEANRIPFDIPEAESELVAGVTTEYTGMKFALFYMAEYIHTIVASAVGAALFLGGWDGPFWPGLHWMVLKTLLLFVLVYWIRWSLLRFRSDQLMGLCWKYLVPASVLLVGASAAWVVFT
jgi:NADH-quinone oxidoreductase subunit H